MLQTGTAQSQGFWWWVGERESVKGFKDFDGERSKKTNSGALCISLSNMLQGGAAQSQGFDG